LPSISRRLHELRDGSSWASMANGGAAEVSVDTCDRRHNRSIASGMELIVAERDLLRIWDFNFMRRGPMLRSVERDR